MLYVMMVILKIVGTVVKASKYTEWFACPLGKVMVRRAVMRISPLLLLGSLRYDCSNETGYRTNVKRIPES